MNTKITNELKEMVYQYYISYPKSLDEVAKEFGLCRPTVSKILKEKNCKLYTRQDLYNIGVKENFFETIETEKQAYYLGLFIADGCVYRFRKNTMFNILSLQREDSYMVEQFAKDVCATRKIVTDKRDGSRSITVTSNKMAYDLSKYGVIEDKTFMTYLPKIDKNLYSHLIRGILDGDGNIGYRKTKEGRERWQIAFCGSYKLMSDIRDFLIKELNVYPIKISKEDSIFSIRWTSKSDFYLICNYLYVNSHIYLNRKYEIFEDFCIKNNL